MKALTTKTNALYRTYARTGMMILAAFTFMVMNSACGSKKTSTATGIVTPACSGCSTNQGYMTGAVAKQGSSSLGGVAEADLDFFADATQLAYFTSRGAPFYGSATASGTLFIPYTLSDCGISAGTYSISSTQQGYWGGDGNGQSVQMVMQSTGGPAALYITVNGYVSSYQIGGATGRVYPYRLQADFNIQAQNAYGRSCTISMY